MGHEHACCERPPASGRRRGGSAPCAAVCWCWPGDGWAPAHPAKPKRQGCHPMRCRPHQIYAAGDLSDPHGTHRTCLQARSRGSGGRPAAAVWAPWAQPAACFRGWWGCTLTAPAPCTCTCGCSPFPSLGLGAGHLRGPGGGTPPRLVCGLRHPGAVVPWRLAGGCTLRAVMRACTQPGCRPFVRSRDASMHAPAAARLLRLLDSCTLS